MKRLLLKKLIAVLLFTRLPACNMQRYFLTVFTKTFSAPVQTGSGANPASYKMGTGSLSRG